MNDLGIEIDMDIAQNVKPILIVPLYSSEIDVGKLKFTQNKQYNKQSYYDTNDKYRLYNHVGKYEISASSVSPPSKGVNYEPYNAFNKGDSGWKSEESGGSRRTWIYSVNKDTTTKSNIYQTKYAKLHNGPSYYNGKEGTRIKQQEINYFNNVKDDTYIQGEWLQIHLPQNAPIYLFKYSIKVPPPSPTLYPEDRRDDSDYGIPFPIPPPAKYTSHFPKVFAVVGSLDGNNWHYIDQQSFIEPPDLPKDSMDSERRDLNFKQGMTIDSANNTVTFHVNSLQHYTYFRLIITEMFPGNTCVQISQWSLFAFVDIITPNAMSVLTTESFVDARNSQDTISKMNWDNFSKSNGMNLNLEKKYKEQLTMIEQAKQDKNMLPNLDSFQFHKKEGFDTHGYSYPPNSIVNNQINPLDKVYSDYIIKANQINQNYFDLGNKINTHGTIVASMDITGDPYDYKNNSFNRKPTKVDGWITDNKEQVLEQNNILILSTITVASLIIALIIVQ